jgi:hypothetical protein
MNRMRKQLRHLSKNDETEARKACPHRGDTMTEK